MGIRVHKVLGYGLLDALLSYEKGWQDPRVNKEALEEIYERKPEDFVEFLKAKKLEEPDNFELSLSISMLKNESKLHHRAWEPSDSVHSDPHNTSNVLVFTPPGYQDWRRYDDIIDYAEICYFGTEGSVNSIKPFDVPIYPFLSWMDKNTGERLVREEDDNAFIVARLRGDTKYELTSPELLALKERMAPMVPWCVRHFIEFSKILDMEAVKDLRPVIFTYWS